MSVIRRATEENVNEVVALSELWVSEENTYGLARSDSASFLKSLGRGYFYVAINDSFVVGYIVGSIHQSDGLAVIPKGEEYLEIDEVYVHPDHRREGMGHDLVDALLAEAETCGICRALVYSATKQWEQVVGFYQKHGFKMWFVEMYK